MSKKIKGILVVKGNFTQKQFEALGRIWNNLATVHLPKETDLEFVSLPKGTKLRNKNKEVKKNGKREY
jgi:hypothetical protein